MNRIVVVRSNMLTLEVYVCFGVRRERETGLIFTRVEVGATAQAGFGLGRANELDHCFETDQWLSSPVIANLAEQAMFDRIPFGSGGWIVRDRNGQTKLVSQGLQPDFP